MIGVNGENAVQVNQVREVRKTRRAVARDLALRVLGAVTEGARPGDDQSVQLRLYTLDSALR